MTAWNHDINAAPRDGTRILLAEKIANGLRELSAAMSERNMDMELPDGTIDPTVAAEAIDRLSAEIASLKAGLAEAEAEKGEAVKATIERCAGIVAADGVTRSGYVSGRAKRLVTVIRARGGSDD